MRKVEVATARLSPLVSDTSNRNSSGSVDEQIVLRPHLPSLVSAAFVMLSVTHVFCAQARFFFSNHRKFFIKKMFVCGASAHYLIAFSVLLLRGASSPVLANTLQGIRTSSSCTGNLFLSCARDAWRRSNLHTLDRWPSGRRLRNSAWCSTRVQEISSYLRSSVRARPVHVAG